MAQYSTQRIKIVSHFKEAEKAGHVAIHELLQLAGDKMAETAAQRLDSAAGQRGYNLYSTDLALSVSTKDAKLSYPKFYGRFFEYGTPTIQAMPFMRPGHRAGRKVIRETAGVVFARNMRRVQVR